MAFSHELDSAQAAWSLQRPLSSCFGNLTASRDTCLHGIDFSKCAMQSGRAPHLQNAKGVVLQLKGAKVGMELSAAVSGIEISLK
jgi:hypothetical protein